MNKQELKKAHCIKMAVDGKMTVAQAMSLSTRLIKQLKSKYQLVFMAIGGKGRLRKPINLKDKE